MYYYHSLIQYLPNLPTAPLFFDSYAVAGGYYLHKVKATQNLCIRVRRSYDNAEQDFGFEGNNWVDRTAILDFVNEFGAGDGFVTTWYDPWNRGAGYNAECTIAGQQPYIVYGGILETINNRPICDARGRSTYFNAPAIATDATNTLSIGCVSVGLHSGSVQVPIAHRSHLNWGKTRLAITLESDDRHRFYRTTDVGDTADWDVHNNYVEYANLHIWSAYHTWTSGGYLTHEGTVAATRVYVAYFNSDATLNASYCPFMGDSQGQYWTGKMGGGWWSTAALDLNSVQLTAWGL